MDTHVIASAIAFGLAPEGATQEQVQEILEAVIPRVYFYDYNEVYGSFGQMFKIPELANLIRQRLPLHPAANKYAHHLYAWMNRADDKRLDKLMTPPPPKLPPRQKSTQTNKNKRKSSSDKKKKQRNK